MTFLSSDQLNQYKEKGFVAPVDVLTFDEAKQIRFEIENIERQWPNELEGLGRNYVHMLSPLLDEVCHNSKIFARLAIHNNADYLAFGSFYKSTLKPKAKKAKLNILKWAKKNVRKPIVAIGGINNRNYKKIIRSGAKYIAISSYIWDNPKLKPEIAIKKFK